jgi:hypothetical protein
METKKESELALGDVVRRIGYDKAPWNTAVVVNVKGREVTMFRPYVVTSDFSYTGGIIPYIGTEKWSFEARDYGEPIWEVLETGRVFK